MRWTKPYFGLTHLTDVPHPWQISVQAWESFAEADVLCLMPPRPFTLVKRETFSTVEDAKAWAEFQAGVIVTRLCADFNSEPWPDEAQ